MRKLLIHAWPIDKVGSEYFLPYTHLVYLREIIKYYDKICLLSPVNKSPEPGSLGQQIRSLKNVEVYELPYSINYVSAAPYFFHYLAGYIRSMDCTRSYVRYPVAFGWLSWFFFRNKSRILHFVGDPIEVTLTNPNHSIIKKCLLILFFLPEHFLYLLSCYGTPVYTNGNEIQRKLNRFGIKAEAVISTTLVENDFYFNPDRRLKSDSVNLLYVGYLRKWKGVEIIIQALMLLLKKYPGSSLTIVGTGEFEHNLKQIIREKHLEKAVIFRGHIEARDELNECFRNNDLFCLTSTSEGSPRVVLEAMANGIGVIATPVGSLPFAFKDRENIFFVPFENPDELYSTIEQLMLNPALEFEVRRNAYQRSKSFTIEGFIRNIFK